MNPSLANRIAIYLQKVGEDVKRAQVQKIAEKYKYSVDDFYIALEVLTENYANIAQWSDQKTKINYLRYYPPNDLTNKVQECLDRGDDW